MSGPVSNPESKSKVPLFSCEGAAQQVHLCAVCLSVVFMLNLNFELYCEQKCLKQVNSEII